MFLKKSILTCVFCITSHMQSMSNENLKKMSDYALSIINNPHVNRPLLSAFGAYYIVKNIDVSGHLYDYTTASQDYNNNKKQSDWDAREQSRYALKAWGAESTTYSDTTPEREIGKRIGANVFLIGITGWLLYDWYHMLFDTKK